MARNDTPFTIRDRRRTHFFTIDNIVIDKYGKQVGGLAIGVYATLCRFANRDEECWPSHQTIADCLDISRRQVIREIKKLEEAGLIAVVPRMDEATGRQTSNLYILLDVGVTASHSPHDSESPPGDSQSPTPHDTQTPPRDSESPEQNIKNNTHFVEENTNNNGGGGLSIPDEITNTFMAITEEEPTEQDNQHLAELAVYPQCVVKESFFALRERMLNPDKETIRNKAAWLVGTARSKAEEENERLRRIEEVNRTLTARQRYEIPEEYRDIIIG